MWENALGVIINNNLNSKVFARGNPKMNISSDQIPCSMATRNSILGQLVVIEPQYFVVDEAAKNTFIWSIEHGKIYTLQESDGKKNDRKNRTAKLSQLQQQGMFVNGICLPYSSAKNNENRSRVLVFGVSVVTNQTMSQLLILNESKVAVFFFPIETRLHDTTRNALQPAQHYNMPSKTAGAKDNNIHHKIPSSNFLAYPTFFSSVPTPCGHYDDIGKTAKFISLEQKRRKTHAYFEKLKKNDQWYYPYTSFLQSYCLDVYEEGKIISSNNILSSDATTIPSTNDWWSGRTTLYRMLQNFMCQRIFHGTLHSTSINEEFPSSSYIPSHHASQVPPLLGITDDIHGRSNESVALLSSEQFTEADKETKKTKKDGSNDETSSRYTVLQSNMFQNMITIQIEVKSQLFFSLLTLWGLHYAYLIFRVYYCSYYSMTSGRRSTIQKRPGRKRKQNAALHLSNTPNDDVDSITHSSTYFHNNMHENFVASPSTSAKGQEVFDVESNHSDYEIRPNNRTTAVIRGTPTTTATVVEDYDSSLTSLSTTSNNNILSTCPIKKKRWENSLTADVPEDDALQKPPEYVFLPSFISSLGSSSCDYIKDEEI